MDPTTTQLSSRPGDRAELLAVKRSSPSDRDEQLLDDALERLAAFELEYRGGLANHGPMVVSALCRLGRADAIANWVARYSAGLEPLRAPITTSPQLGQPDHSAAWIALFEHQLANAADWREIVGRWLPLLAPGLFAAAGHGLLRTAHAVRSLVRRDNPTRRRELAFGLAHWAACYRPLVGHVCPDGQQTLAAVLDQLPAVPLDDGWLITERVRSLDRDPSFVEALSRVAASELEPGRMLSAFAPWAHAGAANAAVAHVHVLTPIVAVLELAPLIPNSLLIAMLKYTLHASASLTVCWHPSAPVREALVSRPGNQAGAAIDVEAMIDVALDCADEHAIKVVDACLLGFEHCGDPAILHAGWGLCGAIADSLREPG